MNIFFVSTSLQAAVAGGILRQAEHTGKNVVIYDVASGSINSLLDKSGLQEKASLSIRIDAKANQYVRFCILLLIFCTAKVSGAKVFTSNILNSFISRIIGYIRFTRLYTFDEGGFNVDQSGPYHKALRGIGEQGHINAIKHIGRVTKAHYTLFDEAILKQHVFYGGALKAISIPWSDYLIERDIEYLTSFRSLESVLLGTAYQNHVNGDVCFNLAEQLVSEVDLIIGHPANTRQLEGLREHKFTSPAEAILGFLAQKEITVYHFSSTVAYNLAHLKNIRFIELGKDSDSIT